MDTTSHPKTNRHPILLGLGETLKIDLIIVPSVFLIAITLWITGLGSRLAYSNIPEWAFAVWANVHGLSVSTLGFDFSLAPSLATLAVWALLMFAARRLVVALSEQESENDRRWVDIIIALSTFVVAYAGPLLVIAVIVSEVSMTPMGVFRLLLFLVSAPVAGFVLERGFDDIPRLDDIDADTWETVAALTRRILWGSVAVSVLGLGLGLWLRWSDLAESMNAYSSPVAAGIGLLVVQILFAPGILFATLSWMAGSGVSVGAGGLSSVFHSVPGPVPDVPVLELLIGDYPGWTKIAPVLLVLTGLLAVIVSRAHAHRVMLASWTGIGVTVVKMWVILEVVAVFSTGAMGPLSLADFGPSALTSAAAVVAWLGVGMVAGLGLTKLSQMTSEDESSTSFPEDPDR